ncbi:MAG: hypothetical protein NZ518_04165 [Dehalococcoidia bacterium]|nr:hypothetical protein [Dehalococcoidia bacterium]
MISPRADGALLRPSPADALTSVAGALDVGGCPDAPGSTFAPASTVGLTFPIDWAGGVAALSGEGVGLDGATLIDPSDPGALFRPPADTASGPESSGVVGAASEPALAFGPAPASSDRPVGSACGALSGVGRAGSVVG